MTQDPDTQNINTSAECNWGAKCGAASEEKAPKKRRFKSIKLQTWTYFFLLATLSLFVLWLFQLLFFKTAYQSMKQQEIERLGTEIAAKYPGNMGNEKYKDYLRETALRNGLNIVIFRTEETGAPSTAYEVNFVAEYLSSQFNADELSDKGLISVNDPHIIVDWERFYENIKSSDKVSYVQHSKYGNYFVYGADLGGGKKYLYLTSPYQPIESTISVMAEQFLLATVVCLVLATVVSFFISERITKPVTEFSRVAQKLGAGDYSVRFKGNGYVEMENLADTLNAATVEFGKTEQLRRDFLANVSHDLRTPLTMVKAYAEMIRDISGNDELKRTQHSQVIIDEADRLNALVNDILDLSKLQSGTSGLTLKPGDMRVLTKMVVERFDVYAERDGFEFEFESEGDCYAYCDYKRIEQVIYNLIGNAVNYTSNKKVTVKVTEAEDKVRVSVRDYGSGIAPEELDKVWERYYRASQSKRKAVGSGLGLSIVKDILTLHNAQFEISSKLGEGTEFWFELDHAPKTEEEPPAQLEEPKKRKRRK